MENKRESKSTQTADTTTVSFITNALWPFKWLIGGQLIIGLIWAFYLSVRPYILKIILDRIPYLTPDTVMTQLAGPTAAYVLSGLFIVVVFRCYDLLWLHLSPPLKRHVGALLMNTLMHHSLVLFQTNFAGNLANKVRDVMNGIPDVLKIMVNNFVSQFLSIAIAIVTVWTINYQFALLLIAWIVVFVIGALLFSRKAKKFSREASEIRSGVVGTMVDMLSNIMSIHLFSAQKTESKRFRVDLDKWVTADQRRDWLFLYMFAFQGVSFVIYQAICCVLLIMGLKKGLVTAGDFALILTINTNIITMLWSLSSDILQFSDLLGNITQGLDIILTPLAIMDKPDAKLLQVTQGRIVFNNITFYYKNNKPLFNNLSITIEPGQKVGLVGYSGGGKSTFVNLILRLYDVTQGHIYIDGQDVCDVTQDSLHAAIGMIPQDPSLFNRSIRENIRYGCMNATDEQVIKAAERAHAHEFIVKLPHGYDMLVGERGSKLSGGQRQRIAIARAMLKNAPILMLDEATSQLDTLTERKIQESLWELMQGKTTLVIAHRLSTLLHMDRILVFERGTIVEDGTHYELLARNGLYKTLWEAQVDGFLPNKKEEGH